MDGKENTIKYGIVFAFSILAFLVYRLQQYGIEQLIRDFIDLVVTLPFWWIEQLVGVAILFIKNFIPDMITATGETFAEVKWFRLNTLEIPSLF